jgi:hypothetical protein
MKVRATCIEFQSLQDTNLSEDVLQAILIHYVGIMWCIKLKEVLKDFALNGHMWKWSSMPTIPHADVDRGQYFLGSAFKVRNSMATQRKSEYIDTFFLSQLPASTLSPRAGGYDHDESPRVDGGEKTSSIKQELLRKIASEVLLHRQLYGEVAVVQSDLQWYATGLPHSTIFAVMRFIGFSEEWIDFFKKSLEAPLNMASASDSDEDKRPRTRRRGVPMAHAPEKLIGELVLFFLDVAVNQDSSLLLYRLHDDLWLAGPPDRCEKAWITMKALQT